MTRCYPLPSVCSPWSRAWPCFWRPSTHLPGLWDRGQPKAVGASSLKCACFLHPVRKRPDCSTKLKKWQKNVLVFILTQRCWCHRGKKRGSKNRSMGFFFLLTFQDSPSLKAPPKILNKTHWCYYCPQPLTEFYWELSIHYRIFHPHQRN